MTRPAEGSRRPHCNARPAPAGAGNARTGQQRESATQGLSSRPSTSLADQMRGNLFHVPLPVGLCQREHGKANLLRLALFRRRFLTTGGSVILQPRRLDRPRARLPARRCESLAAPLGLPGFDRQRGTATRRHSLVCGDGPAVLGIAGIVSHVSESALVAECRRSHDPLSAACLATGAKPANTVRRP